MKVPEESVLKKVQNKSDNEKSLKKVKIKTPRKKV